ncbi:hypothetical protein EPUS_09098 [Endocarpon pusillum Z07020]|uniref:Uncharacterized protein n=1 Tax=Endocarpon pusillum (strain Z07020 / HMAS-L-300199) TaxID=1263415 RepID=U1GBG5_ENDPU|nr:uncharacterized protein EPUS_09098 [Endocarpon pusillum Z07020]ERF74892.1 hypothetical protein EPUS_09098 [Endocarpon pusillum Z07020]
MEDIQSPSFYMNDTTPTKLADVDRIEEGAILNLIPPQHVITKLSKALRTALTEIQLQKDQINLMTAAAQKKALMSQSKRQINHPIGEPRNSEVKYMRAAVMARKTREDAALERKKTRETKKRAELITAASVPKITPQTEVEESDFSEAVSYDSNDVID